MNSKTAINPIKAFDYTLIDTLSVPLEKDKSLSPLTKTPQLPVYVGNPESAVGFVPASSGLAKRDGDSSPCSAINLRAVRLEGLVAPLCLRADLLEFGFRAQRGQAGDTI